jgi:hypothetical protein
MATQDFIEARGLSKQEVQTAIGAALAQKNIPEAERQERLRKLVLMAVGNIIIESREIASILYNRITELYPDIAKTRPSDTLSSVGRETQSVSRH